MHRIGIRQTIRIAVTLSLSVTFSRSLPFSVTRALALTLSGRLHGYESRCDGRGRKRDSFARNVAYSFSGDQLIKCQAVWDVWVISGTSRYIYIFKDNIDNDSHFYYYFIGSNFVLSF
jgi:hypothetical protein